MYKILVLVSVGFSFFISQAFAQEITFGEKPLQVIEITIDESGIAHVVHQIEESKKTRQVETYNGVITNLSVTNQAGNDIEYFTLEKQPVAIVLPPSSNTVFIKYDLADVLSLKEGVWRWNYTGTEKTNFYFPENVDAIWINDRPIYIGEKGIRQHGGTMTLEYVINEPIILKKVSWEDKEFTVGIRTLTDPSGFEFSQPKKSITFDIAKGGSLVTAVIPLTLLWEPYDVYINTNGTLNSEFYNNGTHAWLGFRSATPGTIQIIGTTVVPEFPVFVPLVIGILLVLVLQFRTNLHLL